MLTIHYEDTINIIPREKIDSIGTALCKDGDTVLTVVTGTTAHEFLIKSDNYTGNAGMEGLIEWFTNPRGPIAKTTFLTTKEAS